MDVVRTMQASFIALCLIIMAAGCESTHRRPATVYEGLYAAAAYTEGLALSANRLYLQQALTAEQHLQTLLKLKDVETAVRDALDAYEAGDFSNSQSTLDMAESVLQSIAVLLTRYKKGEVE